MILLLNVGLHISILASLLLIQLDFKRFIKRYLKSLRTFNHSKWLLKLFQVSLMEFALLTLKPRVINFRKFIIRLLQSFLNWLAKSMSNLHLIWQLLTRWRSMKSKIWDKSCKESGNNGPGHVRVSISYKEIRIRLSKQQNSFNLKTDVYDVI